MPAPIPFYPSHPPIMIKRFARNTVGRDFIVGDIHGCFTRLQAKLDAIGFNPSVDRLFCTGDLVDRGPESDQVLDWLARPWFHSVRGNHDQMAIDWYTDKRDDDWRTWYVKNGGGWNVSNPREICAEYAYAFAELPIAIEIATSAGPIGIVHADCPVVDWDRLDIVLRGRDAENYTAQCLWSRDRFDYMFGGGVEGVIAVVVGHTIVERMTSLGNVIYIDTGAYKDRGFTIIDAATLQPA